MANKRTELQDPYIICDNWDFHIPLPAFFSALDIQKTKRTRLKRDAKGEKIINPITKEPERKVWYVWTQSNPPKWNFAEGDTFHDNPSLYSGPWPEVPEGTSIQVQSVQGDKVTIKKTQWLNKISTTLTLTQGSLASLLQGHHYDN